MPAPVKVQFIAGGTKELERAFDTIEARVKKLAKAEEAAARASEQATRRRIQAERKAAQAQAAAQRSPGGGGYRDPGQAGRSYRQVEREAEAHAKRMEKIKERSAIMAGKNAEKAANAEIRAARRAAIESQKVSAARAKGAVSAVGRAGRSTAGTIAGVAGGLGVTAGGYAITNALMGAARLKHQAVGIVQNTRDAKTGKRTQNADELVSFANQMSTTYGVESGAVLEGLGTVAARAGGAEGLRAARKDWEDLTKTAVAYGVSMEDMGGVVAAALNAGVKPGEEMRGLVQDLVASGKIGAVEFSDMARVLAQLAGAGLQTELKGGDMIRRMAGLAQIAVMQKVSPEAARTSTEDLLRDLTMGKKSMDLEKAGVKVFNERGQTLDPSVIMAEMMDKMAAGQLTGPGGKKLKTGQALSYYFTGTSKAIGSALLNRYQDAGGGEAGKKAVIDMISEASGGKLAAGERDKALADMMSTEVTQANVAMNKFKVEIGKMLPQFARLLPELLKVTQGFAKLAVFAAENPFTALSGIFAAHLAKELAAAQLSKLLTDGLTKSLGTGKLSIGNVGAIAMTAAAVYLVGKQIIDEQLGNFEKKQLAVREATADAQRLLSDPASSEESRRAAIEKIKSAKAAAAAEGVGVVPGMFGSIGAAISGDDALNPEKRAAQNDIAAGEAISRLEASLLANNEASKALDEQVAKALGAAAKDLSASAEKLANASPDRSGKPPGRK